MKKENNLESRIQNNKNDEEFLKNSFMERFSSLCGYFFNSLSVGLILLQFIKCSYLKKLFLQVSQYRKFYKQGKT